VEFRGSAAPFFYLGTDQNVSSSFPDCKSVSHFEGWNRLISVHLSTGQILDAYQLVSFLGRGGFGEVWLCRSESMGGNHSLKFISGSDPDLLEKEHHSLGLYRSAAAKLRSPHLEPIEPPCWRSRDGLPTLTDKA
jgi:serine/threonine protein kinase